MANAYIPREQVHEWSEQIGERADQATMSRHLRQQRRLAKFIEENASSMMPATQGTTLWMVGVVCRIFELAGGQVRNGTWAQVRETAAKVLGAAQEALPADEGLTERLRAIAWRAQPHILDEALMALFERPVGEEEPDIPRHELLKVYMMMWVATEVLDDNWYPPKAFEGHSDYAYHHIEPTAP